MNIKIRYIIENWYFFLSILAVTNMLGLYDWFTLMVFSVLLTLPTYLKRINWSGLDALVLIFIIYNLFSGIFSNYPGILYYYGIKTQVVSILFYFIGRSKYFNNQSFLDKARPIFLLIFISSLLLYFFPPSFYTEYKTANLSSDTSVKIFYEATRMSGFWPAPYFLGVTSIISVIYICNKIFMEQEFSKRNWIFLSLAVICLFFSQMRVAIAYSILFLVSLTIITVIYRLKTRKILMFFLLFILILIFTIYYIVIHYMPQEFVQYVIDRSVEQDNGLIKERILLFEDFFKYISFIGYGLGRFGHMALEFNLQSITDCDYLRVLCELGYLGLFILLIILCTALFKGFINLRRCFCDFFIIGYFLASMIGAAPLLSINQHSFLLWFCIGHIVQTSQYKLRHENNSHLMGT